MITIIAQIQNEYREHIRTSEKQLKHIEQLLKNHDIQSRNYKRWKHVIDLENVSELLARVEAIFSQPPTKETE